ncbi:MAG: ribosome maturation factor RimP [bacterium]
MVANITNREDELYEALKPVTAPMDVKLIDVDIRGHEGETLVKIVVDSEDGIGLDECEEVTQQVAPVLELEDSELYHDAQLEVTSPGLERRIRRSEELDHYQGRDVDVKCYAPFEDRKKWRGTIVSHTDDELTIEPDDVEPVTIPLNKIASIRLHFDADEFLASGG